MSDSTESRRDRLVSLTRRFVDAFNRDDLDTVMSFFAEDAVYDEFQGRRSQGREAIRQAFEPQFAGEFGVMRFVDDDLFVDEQSGKVMTSWRVTMENGDMRTSFRGLDLLHFKGDRLVQKLTYAKAASPQLEDF